MCCVCLRFGMPYFVSFLVMNVLCLSMFWYALICVLSSFTIMLKRKRELVALLLLSYGCLVALPHDAVGWSAVCDCGISLSYSLFYPMYVYQSGRQGESSSLMVEC